MRQKKVKQLRKQLNMKLPIEADYNKIPKKKMLTPNFDKDGQLSVLNPYTERVVYQYINTNKATYRSIKKAITRGTINGKQ